MSPCLNYKKLLFLFAVLFTSSAFALTGEELAQLIKDDQIKFQVTKDKELSETVIKKMPEAYQERYADLDFSDYVANAYGFETFTDEMAVRLFKASKGCKNIDQTFMLDNVKTVNLSVSTDSSGSQEVYCF